MAFVYRADRKINIQDKEPNSTYPGEYFNNTSLVKDLKAARNVANKLLDSLENNKENKIEENKETNSPNLSQEDGK